MNGHDFPGGVPKAIPYGVYDVGADDGFVTVGVDHDTAEFAVNAIRTWWDTVGRLGIRTVPVSFISMNWRGRPLTDYQVVVETIAATTTETGLTAAAALDTGTYPTGVRISDARITEAATAIGRVWT